MRSVRLMTAIAALALAAAACSSGGEGESATTTSTTTTAPSATTTLPPTTAPATTTTTTTVAETTTTGPTGPVATATIAVVQQHLTALGYYEGDLDGVPGPVTVAAIESFQTDAEITVDGEYGPETAEALADAVEADEDFVKERQEELMELGLYPGPADGDYGGGTVTAVERLQEQCEIDVDGRFTVRTHLCLIAALEADG